MTLPSRNVRVFIYGNLAGILGWAHYVAEHSMDQFALVSLQTFIGALAAAYMVRKDDDQPAGLPGALRTRRESNPEAAMKQALTDKRRHRRGPQAEPSPFEETAQALGELQPTPRPIPREPRFPAVPMSEPSTWQMPVEETVAMPPMRSYHERVAS